jgi:hypothetical protein
MRKHAGRYDAQTRQLSFNLPNFMRKERMLFFCVACKYRRFMKFPPAEGKCAAARTVKIPTGRDYIFSVSGSEMRPKRREAGGKKKEK